MGDEFNAGKYGGIVTFVYGVANASLCCPQGRQYRRDQCASKRGCDRQLCNLPGARRRDRVCPNGLSCSCFEHDQYNANLREHQAGT
jgi:hypothetical protein